MADHPDGSHSASTRRPSSLPACIQERLRIAAINAALAKINAAKDYGKAVAEGWTRSSGDK